MPTRRMFCALAALSPLACAHRKSVSNLGEIYGYTHARPLDELDPFVTVPGFLGSGLADRETGRVLWGEFLGGEQKPKDPEFALGMALPMEGADRLVDLRDEVYPTHALANVEVHVGKSVKKVNAYPGIGSGILHGATGKRHARKRDLKAIARAEDPNDTITHAHFDWRRDISESAAQIHEAVMRAVGVLKARRQAAGLSVRNEDLKVDIVAHSLGCLVTRYYLRYGTRRLPDDGSLPALDWAGAKHLRRVVLVGPPNLGTVYAASVAASGDRPAAFLPKYPAPIPATFPALYQLMPRPASRAIVYEDGEPVDLYDPDLWESRKRGFFDPKYEKALAQILPKVPTPAQRLEVARRYMRLVLPRARQFHRAMDVPGSPPPGTTLHLFASDSIRMHGTYVASRSTGKRVTIVDEFGDGLVTRRSALGDLRHPHDPRDRIESPIAWDSVHLTDGEHLGMTGDLGLLDNLLYLLLQEPVPEATEVSPGSPGVTGSDQSSRARASHTVW